MYLEHFGLKRLPFEALSNGRVYIDLPEHREAYNTVQFGLRTGEGFIKVVGEVGTGKTALCRSLLANPAPEDVTVYLPNPSLSPHDLLLSVADELGDSAPANASLHRLQKSIRKMLFMIASCGGRAIIFVDEAQAMPPETLEELRLLSNIESADGKLIQVVLFGQPELDEKLADYHLRQLQQRVSFSTKLRPLDRETCRTYIRRRMLHAGAKEKSVFTPASIERIHRGSGGIPRLVNILCHKSLIAAMADREYQVGRRHVVRALEDTDGIQRWRTRPLFRGKTVRRLSAPTAPSTWRPFQG
ncbi:MAG: ExeA family protein [Myxococcota bacterium]